jgi:hypothetical protein
MEREAELAVVPFRILPVLNRKNPLQGVYFRRDKMPSLLDECLSRVFQEALTSLTI